MMDSDGVSLFFLDMVLMHTNSFGRNRSWLGNWVSTLRSYMGKERELKLAYLNINSLGLNSLTVD